MDHIRTVQKLFFHGDDLKRVLSLGVCEYRHFLMVGVPMGLSYVSRSFV
jgi:hypothetical protein